MSLSTTQTYALRASKEVVNVIIAIGLWNMVSLAVEQLFPNSPKSRFIAYSLITTLGIFAAFIEMKIRLNPRSPDIEEKH